jgi:nitrite reductase/ring-hydroxylating ferredoxin subunit
VVATNTPVNYLVALHTKQAAYRSYVIAARLPEPVTTPALYWDTEDPFHYVRVHRGPEEDGDVLLVGGEDHKTGQDDVGAHTRWSRLEHWARARFPELGPVVDRWSGQVMESMDGLAFIGRVEDQRELFVVTGDSGNGLTHGTIAAMLLPELIGHREHGWADVYDPQRVRMRALGTFARENLNVAAQYTAWAGPAAAIADIPRNGGAVIRRGLSRIAVHRDAEGALHERSAVCPHLGCLVRWNDGERTWDCPCHGSRFDAYGKVLHGPASRDLAPVEGMTDAVSATPASSTPPGTRRSRAGRHSVRAGGAPSSAPPPEGSTARRRRSSEPR